jgi:hypothetical protein
MITSTGEVHASSTEAPQFQIFLHYNTLTWKHKILVIALAGMTGSGAPISLCNRSLIQSLNLPVVGNVKNKGIFGYARDANLVVLQVRIADSNDIPNIPIHCAVSDSIIYINDVLILTCECDPTSNTT